MSKELNYKEVVTEKVKYKGELRIVGLIMRPSTLNSSGVLAGYIIMTEKTKKFKHYTIEQTKWLLARYKFVNAGLVGNEIKNTECDMYRLPKFNTRLEIIDEDKMLILGKIYVNDTDTTGFRVLTNKGKVADLSYDDVMRLSERGIEIVNAKIVNKSGNKFISAIKQEFTRIDVGVNSVKKEEDTKGNTREYIEGRKRDSIRKACPKLIANILEHDITKGAKDKIRVYKGKITNKDKIKIMTIISKEFTNRDKKELAIKILNSCKNSSLDIDLGLYAIMQFVIDDDMIDEIYTLLNSKLRKISNYSRHSKNLKLKTALDRYNKLKELEFITEKLDDILCKVMDRCRSELGKQVVAFDNGKVTTKKDVRHNIRVAGFNDKKTIENMGFYLGEDSSTEHKDRYGFVLTALCDYIPNYSYFKSKSNCLGDLLLIAKVEAVLKHYGLSRVRENKKVVEINYESLNRKVTYCDEERALEIMNDQKEYTLGLAEMILAVLAIYRPDLAKDYLGYLKDKLPEASEMLPDFNFEEQTDYGLSHNVKTFYKSGMCIIVDDKGDKVYNTRYNRTYVYRPNVKGSDYYKDIVNELGAVVRMITSDRCTDRLIDGHISNINPL